MNDKTPVIIDNGSSTCRVGFAGEDKPRKLFPTVVGRYKHKGILEGMGYKDYYVGDEAQNKRAYLTLRYPIQYGIVNNWDDMEKIWHHTFYNELLVAPEEHPVLLTEPCMNPRANREKMTQIMFEVFNTPAMYLAWQAVLALYAFGRRTGVVVDSGEMEAQVVPIYEGHALKYAMFKYEICGYEITDFLMQSLADKGYSFSHPDNREDARKIKERFCYVALDYDKETASIATSTFLERSYQSKDGKIIKIGHERFKCPEALFQLSLLGRELWGLGDCLFTTIMKCDRDIRPELSYNIVLAGGNTMFPGLADRLAAELTAALKTYKGGEEARGPVRVSSTPNQTCSAWIGGSRWAATPLFGQTCMTKYEYDEYGPSLVHRKCF